MIPGCRQHENQAKSPTDPTQAYLQGEVPLLRYIFHFFFKYNAAPLGIPPQAQLLLCLQAVAGKNGCLTPGCGCKPPCDPWCVWCMLPVSLTWL